MVSSHLLGVSFALSSAVVWGSADFTGGLATRRSDQFQVVALAALSGTVLLLALALVVGESPPTARNSFWASSAGVSGALGLAALYRALSLGNAAGVASTASVIGAALPVSFTLLTEGLPSPAQLLGFIIAMVGIRLVTQSEPGSREASRHGLVLAVVAGICFGGFFVLIAQVDQDTVFAPLIVVRSAGFGIVLLILVLRGVELPNVMSNPIALLTGVLDASGTVFYLIAERFTRLDIAAVLASLYPATTVLLFQLLLKERASRTQWIGVALCMLAVTLIASPKGEFMSIAATLEVLSF